MSKIIFDKESNIYYFNCPHCDMLCQVHKSDIRCTIFRHAIYKKNLQNVNPHASKEECEKMLLNNEVYGCAKPFKFTGTNVEVCGYI